MGKMHDSANNRFTAGSQIFSLFLAGFLLLFTFLPSELAAAKQASSLQPGKRAGEQARKSAKILFLGDSITAGYGVLPSESYPSLIEKRLKQAGKPIEIVNGGIDGSLSSSAPKRLEFYLRRVKPTHVVIALGGNDAMKGTPPKTIEKNLAETIKIAKKANIKIVLAGMKIFPNLGKEYIENFAAIYPRLAKKNKVVLVPFLLDKVAGQKEFNIDDGFHPNAAGHKLIADTIEPYVLKML